MSFLEDPLGAIEKLGGARAKREALGALHEIYSELVKGKTSA